MSYTLIFLKSNCFLNLLIYSKSKYKVIKEMSHIFINPLPRVIVTLQSSQI